MPGGKRQQTILPTAMTRRQLGGALAAVLAVQSLPAFAVQNAEPVVPTRGFNLPGWVDREDGVAPAKQTLEKLRQLGFETVRLPVAADSLLSGISTRAVMIGRIASAVSQMTALGFSVLVDLHPADKFYSALRSGSPDGEQQAVEAWEALAPMLADTASGKVYAELLNEPPMEPAAWLRLRDRLADTIRARCPRHTIVWGTAPYQGIWELADAPRLADDNAIVAVHYYTPMGFTHQCANWDTSPLGRLANLPFPATKDTPQVRALFDKLGQTGDEAAIAFLKEQFSNPWAVANIAADFATLAQWSARNRCPAIVDEFGVLDFCVDPASRANWVRAVRRAAEANGVGWAYWELDQGFGFIKNRTSMEGFDLSMVEALMGT